MARVALVTGGSRGIGAAISMALKAEGRTVIASYAGNDVAAEAFTKETGIPAMKFDAGDFAACETALATIKASHGPVEILVNNAGITRDGTMARMSPRHVGRGDRHQPRQLFQPVQADVRRRCGPRSSAGS